MSSCKVETDRILYTRDGKEYRGKVSEWRDASHVARGTRVELAYKTLLIPNENISRKDE